MSAKSIFKALVVAFASYSPITFAEWSHYESIDPFSDLDKSYVTPDSFDYQIEDGLAVYLSCEDDGLNFGVQKNLLGLDPIRQQMSSSIDVKLRVDTYDTYTGKWELNVGGGVAWMPLSYVREVVHQMTLGDELRLRTIDRASGIEHNQSISLIGFKRAVRKLDCYKRDWVRRATDSE